MPDKTGEEVQRGLTEGIRISTDAAKTVKSVQKAAAQASTGNYVAAGAELLKSEDTRRIITVLILAAFFMSVVIFFVAPLTLYETIAHAAKTFADKWEQVKENFAVGYYSGTNGRFVSFFKALIGVISSPEVSEAISDASAGEEDLAEEGDLQLLGKKEALRKTYMRKIKACQDKINAREKEVLQQIKDGMCIHLAPVGLTHIADGISVAGVATENTMFGGILLFRFQVRLLVYALVIPGKLLESLAAQLWLVLGDERAPCACIELLDRLIPHAPVIFNMNKADKIAVGLFRANILAVISRNPSREEGSLFLLKHLRSHLEHHRRQDGVRTSVDLGRVFHEILDGDFDLKVVAILGKGIEQVL